MTPQPFTLQVPDSDLADLRARLALTRWPDQAPDAPWAYGTDVGYLRELAAYWADGFDWRAQEARLNAFPQFTVPIQGIDVHYLHVPGVGPDPKPLLMLHGWPGSVVEFLDVIPRLTDPARFGGDPSDAVTLIAPSLPGYGLSFAPNQKRMNHTEVRLILHELMTQVLGFARFAVQGGDWGASIASDLGMHHPTEVVGVHLNMLAMQPNTITWEGATPEELQYISEVEAWQKDETGYQWIQGTKPQTLAFGLSDSPVGLAAWIVEKFRAWSDCDGDVESAISRDHMLADISLYWFTGCIGSSFWLYYARMHGGWPIAHGATVDVPVGYAAFPAELRRPPRSVAERTYTDIRQWTVMPKGGHFAAMEQPEALATDVANFLRPLRDEF